jgi:hypothetical protein
MLEHIIRNILFEQSGDWFIRMPFSEPKNVFEKRRRDQAEKNAEKVGAVSGQPVVLKAYSDVKNPTSNLSDIIKNIVSLMNSKPGHRYGKSGVYDNSKYLYVLATVKSKPRRKVFNLMVFDRSKLGKLVSLLENRNLLDKDLRKFRIGYNLPVLSDQQMITYIDRLKKVVDQSDDAEIDKAWKASGLEKINLSALRSSIKDEEHDAAVEETGKIVNLKNEGAANFTGKAVTVFDPRQATVSYQALSGTAELYYTGGTGLSVFKSDKFKFVGEFKDGVPYNGILKFIETTLTIEDSLHVKTFKGTLTDPRWSEGGTDVAGRRTAFQSEAENNAKISLTLIEAQEAVYDIGLTYKGTYDDESIFNTGVLTQKADSNTTNSVAVSRYKKYNLTKLLTDEIESTNFGTDPINKLPRTHPARLAVKLVVANCKTITGKIESGRGDVTNFVDSENKTIMDDMYGDDGRLFKVYQNLTSKLEKPFKQDTGDLVYKSLPINSTEYYEYSIPKTEITQVTLLDSVDIGGVLYYQFEYFDTELNSIQPSNEIKFYAEASQFKETFIKTQKALGNIK